MTVVLSLPHHVVLVANNSGFLKDGKEVNPKFQQHHPDVPCMKVVWRSTWHGLGSTR